MCQRRQNSVTERDIGVVEVPHNSKPSILPRPTAMSE